MKIQRIAILAGLHLALLCLGNNVSWGQKPPAPANPQAPTINPLPLGLQRGKSVDLVISGTLLASPTGVSLGAPAKVVIPKEDKNGTDATKFKVRIEVPADTPIGCYPFRIATLQGVSNLRVLCVDDLPQIAGNGANRTRTSAQQVAVPCVVNGAVAAEQGDYYKFTVKAGQRLSFDCLARRVGSAMDAYMYLYHAKTMRELAYDNDSPGCQSDPRITYTFKETGEYILEVKDVLNRGGAEFYYRVRIGDFPLATTPLPMAAKRGTKVKVGFAGPAVDGVVPVDVAVAADLAAEVAWVAPKGASGLLGWPVPLMVTDVEQALEKEPNDTPKEANRVSVPGGVTGRLEKGADVDCFVFAAKKGKKLAIEATTLEFYSPSLLLMGIKNAKGASVGTSNPKAPNHPADQRIDFTPAEDGDYTLEVEHLSYKGSSSESYHVSIRPAYTDFDLVLPNERFDVAPGGAAAIPVQVARKGYTGPIEISASGEGGLTGAATIKAGKNAGILLVVARPDLPMGAYQFHIVGKATIDGQPVAHPAAASKGLVSQTLNGLPYPPMHLPTFVAVAVKEKAPFTLALKMDPGEGVPGGKANVTISATREPGFDDEITLAVPTGLPPTVPAPKKMPAIPKGKTEASFPLDLNPKTPMGEYFVMVSAKAKFQGKEISTTSMPLMMVLGAPFDLKVEPATVSLAPGAKAKVKVTARRKGGYKGPIALDFRNLPAGVTGPKISIAADKSDIEVELAADAKTAPAMAANVLVGGTATALNNLQNVSPAFTVGVQKK